MSALTDRIFNLKRRGHNNFEIANITGLTPEQVVARLKDPSLADPSTGVGLLPEAGSSSSVAIPALTLPITVPWDPDLLALTTGSAGPDGANSYMNDTRADVTAAPEIVSFNLDKGVYVYDAMGAYDPTAGHPTYQPNGVVLITELRRRSDDTRIGWASNDDPLGGAVNVFTGDVRQGDFNADMHAAGGAGSDSAGASGRMFITEDMSVTLRAVNQGGYEQDPYTGDLIGFDLVISSLGISIRPL